MVQGPPKKEPSTRTRMFSQLVQQYNRAVPQWLRFMDGSVVGGKARSARPAAIRHMLDILDRQTGADTWQHQAFWAGVYEGAGRVEAEGTYIWNLLGDDALIRFGDVSQDEANRMAAELPAPVRNFIQHLQTANPAHTQAIFYDGRRWDDHSPEWDAVYAALLPQCRDLLADPGDDDHLKRLIRTAYRAGCLTALDVDRMVTFALYWLEHASDSQPAELAAQTFGSPGPPVASPSSDPASAGLGGRAAAIRRMLDVLDPKAGHPVLGYEVFWSGLMRAVEEDAAEAVYWLKLVRRDASPEEAAQAVARLPAAVKEFVHHLQTATDAQQNAILEDSVRWHKDAPEWEAVYQARLEQCRDLLTDPGDDEQLKRLIRVAHKAGCFTAVAVDRMVQFTLYWLQHAGDVREAGPLGSWAGWALSEPAGVHDLEAVGHMLNTLVADVDPSQEQGLSVYQEFWNSVYEVLGKPVQDGRFPWALMGEDALDQFGAMDESQADELAHTLLPIYVWDFMHHLQGLTGEPRELASKSFTQRDNHDKWDEHYQMRSVPCLAVVPSLTGDSLRRLTRMAFWTGCSYREEIRRMIKFALFWLANFQLYTSLRLGSPAGPRNLGVPYHLGSSESEPLHLPAGSSAMSLSPAFGSSGGSEPFYSSAGSPAMSSQLAFGSNGGSAAYDTPTSQLAMSLPPAFGSSGGSEPFYSSAGSPAMSSQLAFGSDGGGAAYHTPTLQLAEPGASADGTLPAACRPEPRVTNVEVSGAPVDPRARCNAVDPASAEGPGQQCQRSATVVRKGGRSGGCLYFCDAHAQQFDGTDGSGQRACFRASV